MSERLAAWIVRRWYKPTFTVSSDGRTVEVGMVPRWRILRLVLPSV